MVAPVPRGATRGVKSENALPLFFLRVGIGFVSFELVTQEKITFLAA